MSKLKLSPPKKPTERWLFELYSRLGEGPFMVKAIAKANLINDYAANRWGDGSTFSSIILVTDDIGGAVLAYSDGTNWLRVTDRAVIS